MAKRCIPILLMLICFAMACLAADPMRRLENPALAIQFAPEDAGMGLTGLEHRMGDEPMSFMAAVKPTEARLWQIGLRGLGATETTTYIESNAPCKRSLRIDPTVGTAALRWEGLNVGDEKGVLDVDVAVRLSGSASIWKIAITNRSTKVGLWEVYFPWVKTGFGTKSAMDVAVPRGDCGILERNATDILWGRYPSSEWPMQFLLVNKGDHGFLLATRDPEAWPKRYYLSPGGEFLFCTTPPDAGKPGAGTITTMEVAIEAYQGSWWEGAKRYRAWALTAPWAKRGPIATRKNVSPALRKTALWWLALSSAGDVRVEDADPSRWTLPWWNDDTLAANSPLANAKRLQSATACFPVPMAWHWYGWQHASATRVGFGVDFPCYFPPKPDYLAREKVLVAAGQTVMPYTNVRGWDVQEAQYPAAKRWAVKPVGGTDPVTENYRTAGYVDFGVMCPTTKFWQQRVNDIAQRVWKDGCGNAIFLGQVASALPVSCFDPAHGHVLGGGRTWVQGYRDMLKPLADAAAAKGSFLAAEGTAEPYLDTVDACLTAALPKFDKEIPLLPAVYSGYTVYFGSPSESPLDTFVRTQARALLWGRQLGWMTMDRFLTVTGDQCVLKPGGQADYLLTCARTRKALEAFLTDGELVGELDTSETPTPKTKAPLPTVLTAVWKAPNGHLLLLLANVTGVPRTVGYDVDAAHWGVPTAKLTVTRIQPDKPEALGEVEVAFQRQDTLGPREILALELAPR